eukprot:5447218-Pyramimonas_sp.AAC.1
MPEADGGRRLIAAVHAVQRVWGRLRRGIFRQCEQCHRCEYVWGNRSRYTSSDSAFARSLASEMAVLRGRFSAAVW